ncbi:MAG: ComF family protein [Chloroflexi bacterium]|nr:ComF family protein [Chloroflexota bacterium]
MTASGRPSKAPTRLARLINLGIDLLYPPRCAGCGRVDVRWCAQCQQELEQVAVDLRKTNRLPPLLSVAATGIHEGKLQQAVHALKYSGATELMIPLGNRLISALTTLKWPIDQIVPVPLHAARQRERGYNQSQQLGGYMEQVLGIPCDPSALLRWRDTPPQVGLNREQRQANVQGAFQANTPLSGTVLLIDDVFTTGATLQACALAAREAGAGAIYALTVSAARS